MIKLTIAASFTALAASLFLHTASASDNSSWQRINAPQQATVTVNGSAREIHPGCAFAGDDYSFYFKQGKSDKLAFFFNGGGACWDSTTCLASLQSPNPAFVPSDDLAPNNPLLQDGVLNLNNPDNPYKDWSIVYLPYCTGDVHFGSKDTAYPIAPGITQTIRHHGFDNFLYSREWIKQRYAKTAESPDKVLVTGVSAGAYGAALNYAHIKDAFPKTKGYLLADSGSGVVTYNLIHDAMSGPNSAWNFDANLPQSVPAMASITSSSPESFAPSVYSALANRYPKDRFSQYTTVHDLIQTMFYNIMLNSSDMSQWSNLAPELFQTWTTRMLLNTNAQTTSPNYRFYIAPGCQHTILRSAAMYSPQTVAGTTFRDWFEGLTGSKNISSWNNTSCTDNNCQYQPLTNEQLSACAMTP